MRLDRFTHFLLHKRLSALAFVFAISFIPIVGGLSLVIVALITVIKGKRDGLFFMLASGFPILIVFWLRQHDNLPIMLWVSLLIAMVSTVVIWIFAIMLREQKSWQNILQLSALAGVLIVSIVHLAYPQVADWWAIQLRATNDHFIVLQQTDKATTQPSPTLTEQQAEVINLTKNYATGMLVAVIMVKAWLLLAFGRWWQGRVSGHRILRQELQAIQLNRLTSCLFMAAIVFWYLGNRVALDIMPILYLLFGTAGLCFIHYVFGLYRTPMTLFWMSLFYIMFIISLPGSILIISLIALLDSCFNLRARIKKA